MNRGDVVLVRFPHASGVRGKKRPAVVVQSDAYAGTVRTLVVAEVTKNLTMAGDPGCDSGDEHRSAAPLPRLSLSSTGRGAAHQPSRSPGERIFENVPR